MKAIKTLLIANRGEIACRVIRTAKRLGLTTVAIYADSDKNSLHCKLADSAFCVGPVPVEKSYLNMHNILNVAQKAHVDAIHPGYGFLSENAEFSKLCHEKGFIFVGPSSKAIAQMAVKDEAKRIMMQANVPVVPGYHGADQSLQALTQAADEIGYPVILKAAKGGGGKGMRVVHQKQDLSDAIASAKRESLSSFGDDTVFIEKYLVNARHIEVQIFRDQKGNAVHLFERDCSLQRRHQKMIEETPALHIPPNIKAALYNAACNAAHAIDYHGAGTVEFLYAAEKFYFMEMNTRLQVEHPVTEMVTNLDLVEWQIRIARGETLPLHQNDIKSQGHAIEARIYAEDAEHGFLPATGTIKKMITVPSFIPHRLDNGIQTGDHIGIYFDPLLAKLIVHGATREEAIATLSQALDHYHLVGITTNLPFLRNIIKEKAFVDANISTQFLEKNLSTLLPKPLPISGDILALACLAYLCTRSFEAQIQRSNTADPYSPFNRLNAWRLNLPASETLSLMYQHHILHVQMTYQMNEYLIVCDELKLNTLISGEIINDRLKFAMPTKLGVTDFFCDLENITIFYEGSAFQFKINIHPETQPSDALEHKLLAPMPGIVTKVWVKDGEKVQVGAKLLALEAMKMEHMVCAPKEGLIKSVHYQIGDQVEEGCELIDFE